MRQLNSICVVIPAYNEESTIEKTVSLILSQIGNLSANASILVVDDGSSDSTLGILKKISDKEERLSYLSFTRNFGHQIALRAGLDASVNYDLTITMDADLQHPPDLIPKMIEQWQSGADMVVACRSKQDGATGSKRFGSKVYNYLLKILSEYPINEGSSDFRLMDRKVVKLVSKLSSDAVFLRGIIPWFGFKTATVNYDEPLRSDGETKYSLIKMIQLAVLGVMSVSVRPLRAALVAGFLLSTVAFLYGLYAVFVKFFTEMAVPGWTSILASVLFIGGLQLMTMGILGEYLAKMFLSTLERPAYVLKDSKTAANHATESSSASIRSIA